VVLIYYLVISFACNLLCFTFSFKVIIHFGFILSQTFLALTKFIQKCQTTRTSNGQVSSTNLFIKKFTSDFISTCRCLYMFLKARSKLENIDLEQPK
jgi:hypothetical protein